jgi:hypothetical protein
MHGLIVADPARSRGGTTLAEREDLANPFLSP